LGFLFGARVGSRHSLFFTLRDKKGAQTVAPSLARCTVAKTASFLFGRCLRPALSVSSPRCAAGFPLQSLTLCTV